ncbi:ribokinase, partial [candidate division KSB1 bacterium]|nr:ribokinase [candidate division KSB1 bacterium]
AEEIITTADIVLMQLETPLKTMRYAAEMAHRAGVPVILNPAPAQPLDDEFLKIISILTPNETEAELLTGIEVTDENSARKAADALLGKGLESVIITLGAKGAFIATNSGSTMVPGFSVKAVDTTAAGDVFNGALAVSIANDFNLDQCVRFSSAAAAISVTRLGAQTSAPGREEILQFLKKQGVS